MPLLSIKEKAARTGNLLWGMREPRAKAELAPFGFNEDVLDEGWKLVSNVNNLYHDRTVSRPVGSAKKGIIEKVDAFENLWFPIVNKALVRRFPEATEQLFHNLGRAEGQPAAYGVQVFLERLAALEKGEAPFGADGPEAREYLRRRGLTDEIVRDVASELEARKEVAEGDAPEQFDEKALEAAVEEMWAFYLDWSATIRGAITDGNLLRMFGFKKRSGGRSPKAPEVIVQSERMLSEATPVPQLSGE